MNKLITTSCLCIIAFLSLVISAYAGTYDLWNTGSGYPDHSKNYIYGFYNPYDFGKEEVVGAQLTITNLRDSTYNDVLYVNLLDNSYELKGLQTRSEAYSASGNWFDRPSSSKYSYDYQYPNDAHMLLTKIENVPSTPKTITYNFTGGALDKLITYLGNNNYVGLGFDFDCKYGFTGMNFQVATLAAPVPEPATMLLVGGGLLGLSGLRRKLKRSR